MGRLFVDDDLLQRVALLNCLRAVAALLVFFSHAEADHLVWIDPLVPIRGEVGMIGVYVFFVLSGFLIWSTASKILPGDAGLRIYAIHRVTRILPLYYVNIAFVVLILPLLWWTQFRPDLSPEIILRHLFFTQSLIPDVSLALNPPLWTLTHEALFYVTVPVLFFLRLNYIVIAVLSILAHRYAVLNPTETFSPFLFHTPLFAIGIAVAATGKAPTIWLIVPLAILSFISPPGYYRATAIAALVLATLSLARLLPIWRSWPIAALGFCGVISYSLYIWHWLLIVIVGPALIYLAPLAPWMISPGEASFPTAIVFTAFVVVFSAASYYLIEAPSMGRLRRAMEKGVR